MEDNSWRESAKRIQIAMWLDDGAKCSVCDKGYSDVDNFLSRKVRAGNHFGKYGNNNSQYLIDWFVDDECWDKYKNLGKEDTADG